VSSAPSFELPAGRRLRVLEESDAAELHALIVANRAHLARWMPWAARQTPEDTIDFIRATRRQLEGGNGFQTALVVRRRIVGVAGYHAISWPHRSTSLGYWLAEAEQGYGTMTLAVRALVDHALGELGLNRVEIRADVENRRSRAIPERLGFQGEGTLRQAERIGDGYRDQALYAMLAEEWIGAG
jgi:ribosomal-protein-serine acetyltransferase